MDLFDRLICTSMKITDRLIELKQDPSFVESGEIELYLSELESVCERLTMYPKQDRDYLLFKQMVFPWIVLQTMSHSNALSTPETHCA